MSTPMSMRTTLLVAASSTLLLGVVFLAAGAPVWSWATIFALAGVTSVGAAAARGER